MRAVTRAVKAPWVLIRRIVLSEHDALMFFGGVALVSAGAWWVYAPLGLLVPGVVFVALSVFGSLRGDRRRERR